MGKVIAIANQKGGVTKTTTTVNLGIGLANKGYKVLLVDVDSQGSLTASLGFGEPDQIEVTLPTLLADMVQHKEFKKEKGLLKHKEGITLVPCNIEMSAFEVNITNLMSREYLLKDYISKIKDDYDFIILDCMPSLGIMTINALTAADTVIIPVQATYLPVKGLQQLITTIGNVQRHLNPSLAIDGVLISMVDERTIFSRSIISLLKESYGRAIKIYKTRIPASIKAAECSALGCSVYKHIPKSKVAEAYINLIEEVLDNEK